MHTEIERKFIVTDSTFKESAVRIMDIRQGYIGTPSGEEARVSIRDEKAWVIIKSCGEFYPCKPDIFEKTYEEVAE